MAQLREEDGMSREQVFALIFETTSARNLLGHGIWTLRNAAFMETTLDPIMTMLSIGLEKMMKMALGLLSVADTGTWPPHTRFQSHWRHDLVLMNSELVPALGARLHLATHRPVVEPKLAAIESDPAWGPILDALTRYGVSGRFYYLDQLAERPQAGEQPKALWDQAERELIRADPALDAAFHAAAARPLEFEAFLQRLEGRMAQTIEDYWELLCFAGMHRMLGQRGVSWGTDARPDMVGRQIRPVRT